MPSNQVKFKVYAPNYEKLSKTNPSGLSYDIRYFVPIYDPTFQSPSAGSIHDVTRSDFLLENGMSHSEWWEQFETTTGGQVTAFDGDKLWLRGSFDQTGRYQYVSGYVLDVNNVNVTTGLFNQGKTVSDIVRGDTWKVKPYTPLSVSSTSGAVVGGSYDCVIPGGAGNFSWNKIAIFLAELDVNGNETGNIFLFGMVYSNVRLVKNRLVNSAGLTISPNFTIRFNVLISGETYEPSRYDYLFFTESFWYFVNTDTITSNHKVIMGVYDGQFADAINKPLNLVRMIDGSTTENFSIGGIKTGTDGAIDLYDEYAFRVDWGRLDQNRNYSRLLHLNAYRNGAIQDLFGSIVIGRKVQWDAYSGFAWDMNHDTTGYGINSITDGSPSNGNIAIGKSIHTSGNFNLTYGDGTGLDAGSDIHYGMQTHGNGNINVGIRNRLGSLYEDYNPSFGTVKERHAYGWFAHGTDNYSQGSIGVAFGLCNHSEVGYTFMFGNGNRNRYKTHTDDGQQQSYGSLVIPVSGSYLGKYRTENINNWMMGSYNSIYSRAVNSGSTGEFAPVTNTILFGNHLDIMDATVRNMYVFGELSSVRWAGAHTGNPEGANTVSMMLAYRGHLENVIGSSVNVLELSTIQSVQWGFSSHVSSHMDLKLGGVSSRYEAPTGYELFSSVVDSNRHIAHGVNGHMIRPAYRFASSAMTGVHAIDGSTGSIGERVYDVGLSGPTNTIFNRDFDPDRIGVSKRNAWLMFHCFGHCGTHFIGKPDTTIAVDGGLTQIIHTNSMVSELQLSGYSGYVFVEANTTASHLVSVFNETTRTVHNDQTGGEYTPLMYVTKTSQPTNMSSTDPATYSKALKFVGDLYQITKVVQLTYDGKTWCGFKLGTVEDNAPIFVANNQYDRGFNFYQGGTAFVLCHPERIQYIRSGGSRGAKGIINSPPSWFQHDIKFVVGGSFDPPDYNGTTVINAYHGYKQYAVVNDASCDIYGRLGGLSISQNVRAGHMDHGMHIGFANSFANTYGSSFIGNRINHVFATKNGGYASPPNPKYVQQDVESTIKYDRFNFQIDHKDVLGAIVNSFDSTSSSNRMDGGLYDSVFDSWHGKELHANLNMYGGSTSHTAGSSGHTAFTRMFGSHLYIGRDFVDGSIGTSGVMYADLFGYDINVMVRDCGANLYKPQYNIHAHGLHLLVTRSDQFVFGTLNMGDPQNLFEFGLGFSTYTRMREGYDGGDTGHYESRRSNGFAFGYIYGSTAQYEGGDAKGQYPALKISTGVLHFEEEQHNNKDNSNGGSYSDRVIISRMMFVGTASIGIAVGDPICRKAPAHDDIFYGSAFPSIGQKYAPVVLDDDTHMEYIHGAPAFEWTPLYVRRFCGIALKDKSANVGDYIPVAFKGGPFKLVRKLTTSETDIPVYQDPGFPDNWECVAVYKNTVENQITYSVMLH